jgi:hypothetical protein
MRYGDISNELPRRIIVVIDVFLDVELKVKKKLKFIPVVEKEERLRRDILSYLYLLTNRREVTLELVSFSMAEEDLSNIMDTLDNMGTNPFRYFTVYDSANDLVKELPYRPEVFGVLDRPENLLRYGHWGLDFNSL